jgi:ribosomal protein L37E
MKSNKKPSKCDVCGHEAYLIEDTGLCLSCCFGEADPGEPPMRKQKFKTNLNVSDFDKVFKSEKGWTRYDNQARDYVYEYCLPGTFIRIKVHSGVNILTNSVQLDGLDSIRIFAILYVPESAKRKKMVRGLVKAKIVRITEGWETKVREKYVQVLEEAKQIYNGIRIQ